MATTGKRSLVSRAGAAARKVVGRSAPSAKTAQKTAQKKTQKGTAARAVALTKTTPAKRAAT